MAIPHRQALVSAICKSQTIDSNRIISVIIKHISITKARRPGRRCLSLSRGLSAAENFERDNASRLMLVSQDARATEKRIHLALRHEKWNWPPWRNREKAPGPKVLSSPMTHPRGSCIYVRAGAPRRCMYVCMYVHARVHREIFMRNCALGFNEFPFYRDFLRAHAWLGHDIVSAT